MSHVDARLAVHGWALLIERVITDRRPVAHVARELGISRQCAHRWVRRFRDEGAAGLTDRSSRPRRIPTRTSPAREHAVLQARARLRFGPARLSAETGVHARTISRILTRHQIPKLVWCDPVTGDLIRAARSTQNRYEHPRPGDLIHIDVKELGRIPDGGGWRVHGRGARQKFIKPHCPWQNGKVERFNRTLATEWAYRQPFASHQARHDALAPWIEHYNTERIHTGHGTTPTARVTPT